MGISANLGGDTANRTALVGALMGAIHGYTEIPLEWRVNMNTHIHFLFALYLSPSRCPFLPPVLTPSSAHPNGRNKSCVFASLGGDTRQ